MSRSAPGRAAGAFRPPIAAFADRRAWAALDPPGSVLDVGAGTGAACIPLLGRTTALTAVDTDPELLALLARRAGRRRSGAALAACGRATATVGGYLGGHLAMRLGAGSSHAEQIGHLAAIGWQDLCPLAELPAGRPARRQLGYLSLLAVRADDDVSVLSDQCSHLGGPLHQGRLVDDRGDACVVCPWHGSTFRLSDGRVRRGPATATQPAFETRVSADGLVQVRPRQAGRAASRAGSWRPRPFRSAAG